MVPTGALAAALRRLLDPDSTDWLRMVRQEDIVLCGVCIDGLRRLDDGVRAQYVEQTLTPHERDHGATLPGDKRRTEWLAGRLAVKSAARALTDAPSGRALTVAADPDGPTRGRPYLVGAGDTPLPHIGITHSGRWAVGVAADRPVGIDVERVRRFPPAMMRTAFDEDERRAMRRTGLEPDAATALWWTAKEAILKCAGLGVLRHLRRIRITGWSDGRFQWKIDSTISAPFAHFRLHTGQLIGAHAATMVLAGAG